MAYEHENRLYIPDKTGFKRNHGIVRGAAFSAHKELFSVLYCQS